jgi:nitroreductase
MMDNTFESILKRRSIRKYTNQHIEQEKLKGLLQAAMSAPSACNQQPWHFFIINDRNVLNKISEIHSGMHPIKEASIVILVCGEPDKTQLKFFWRQDCAAATQNILIAAQACGLGALWMGIHPDGGNDTDIIRAAINLPEHLCPFSLISLGYPAEEKSSSNRVDESKIHYIGHF